MTRWAPALTTSVCCEGAFLVGGCQDVPGESVPKSINMDHWTLGHQTLGVGGDSGCQPLHSRGSWGGLESMQTASPTAHTQHT